MDHGGMGGMSGMGHMDLPTLPPTLGRIAALDLGAASPLAWIAVALAVAYAVGLVHLARRGVRWPVQRSICWFAGTASVFYVTASGLQTYGMALFTEHMIQHMALTMMSPLLLLMGAPVTLALRVLPSSRGPAGAPRRLLLAGLHSALGRFLSNPLFTVPLFIASLYGVYFTGIFDDLMSSPAGHLFMLTHFLVTGLLFFGPILSIDPWPRHSGHAARMLELFLPAPFHAFFGVIVMMTNSVLLTTFAHPPASWHIDPVSDQASAGGIAWAFGEFPTVIVLAVVFFQWTSSEERANRARDRQRDRAIARGESGDDPELVAYNERLRRLAAQRP